MKVSIGIIGMGWVGSSVASSLLLKGICNELLLNDIRPGVAEGEAMDLVHGDSFYPSAKIKAARIAEMLNCTALVVTAGRGGKPGETRLDLLKDNIAIAQDIGSQLKGYKGILIVVSNPVDVLTFFYQKFSEIPSNRVIGTGTMLDTARLRSIMGKKLNIDPRSVHAHVLGEHGDSEVVAWETAFIGNCPLRQWSDWNTEWEAEIAHQVRIAAYEIIKRKGATNHAIGLVTATLLRWIVRGDNRIITVSSVDHKAQSAYSLPCVMGINGIEKVLPSGLKGAAQQNLENSIQVIKKAIDSVDF